MALKTIGLVCALALGLLPTFPSRVRADALDPRLEAATRLYREEGAQKALPIFEKLAGEFTHSPPTRDQAAALHYAGECHWRLGNFPEAHSYLDHALTLERASGDRLSEGKTLNVLGLLRWDEGDYELAIADFRKVGALARAIGDKKLEGSSLNNLSLVYDEQGDYDTSLKQYRQVLELYRAANFPRGVGDTLGNIGGVHLLLGHFREALGYYQQALKISEQLKSSTSMSQDHGNIGLCLLGLGEVDAALVHLDQAIVLATQAGMRQDQAYWLRAKGDGLVTRGQYDLGLKDYRAALAIYEKVDAQAELLEALQESGKLHLLLGDSASAERDFKRALDMARSIGLDRGITLNLISLGDLEFRRKRPDAAIALYEQAQQRAAATRAQQTLALSLLRLARVNRSVQRVALASAETDESLVIAREIGARDLEAEALYSRAEIARLQQHFTSALANYKAAESAEARIGDPDLLWQIQFGRARAQEANGNVSAALASLEAAVQLIEGVRGRLEETRFRSGYVEDKFEVYLELMRLQLQQGRTADAFLTAERLRARSFVEQLSGRSSVPLSARDRRVEAELRERVRQLQQSLADTDDEGAPAYPERATNRFSQELLSVEKEYQTFLDDHARVHAAVAAVPNASSIQRRLAADQALVEYIVGPEGLVVFVLTSRGIVVKSSPVRGPDLAARIALLRDLIHRPDDERWRKPAARLSEELIGPLERAGWLDGVTRLYIVPHGALTYLPFAVLPQPASGRGDLLIDRYTVAYLPAAAALLREPTAPDTARSLLAVAPSRGGLRHAPEEARAIDALFQPNARTLIGGEATEGRFKQLAGGFRVLHLATHGYFNEASPLLSGLELEPDRNDDGMLRVHEILDLPLHADLVTLSACDTALGSGYFAELPIGDEFVGLNRAFLAAGSTSVMATLWQVDDRASVSLMKQFYGRLSESGAGGNAASALTFAQRALRRSPQLGHPYYWAAYVVVGPVNSEVKVARKSLGRTS
ncbi:MAG: CHAT domain-containing protein [Steroidobacteraceae bacterium]|nr:CHAT domain-containing protein [Steroidobacteraceae bacterium]